MSESRSYMIRTTKRPPLNPCHSARRRSEWVAAKTSYELQANKHHQQSTLQLEYSMDRMRSDLTDEFHGKLENKVDWAALKTTLDAQMRAVFRSQFEHLWGEIEDKVRSVPLAYSRSRSRSVFALPRASPHRRRNSAFSAAHCA